MLDHHAELQLDWDETKLYESWPNRLDHRFLLKRLNDLTADTTLAGGAVRVLDVAAAGATHTCEMSLRGACAVALDPSPAMLQAAREHMRERGAQMMLVRGIAETLPFRDGVFDRVLCHSAIDHVAAPSIAAREMSRVLAPDGRLVITAVNYGSVSARLSRLLYSAARGVRLVSPENHLFWDSPVPIEHTFECTYERLRQLFGPYLEFERAFGVSIGWGVPGWGGLLERLSRQRAMAMLQRLDRWAARAPAAADFIYTVWRPRPASTWPVQRPPDQGGYVVQPDDVVYSHRVKNEQAFWSKASFRGSVVRSGPTGRRWANAAYTGDPERSWLDDLVARGPFRDVAVLGCDEEQFEKAWLSRDGSPELDIYELTPHAIRQVRRGLGDLRRRARFIRSDLNFVELPPATYDLIWSSGCLHHVINLEHLFAQVARALRPGGLFALHDYVGERRRQYTPERLARMNALLREVPARFRLSAIKDITASDPADLSTFCSARSDEILPLAERYFEPVHVARFGTLFPLPLFLDLDAIAREDPALFERLQTAERDAARDPHATVSSAYAVYRKRS
jgi:SAM-dependent methyltransferase